MPLTPYKLTARIEGFFQAFVNKPFEEHERSDAWVKEVVNRDWDYRTKTVIGQGRTDFTQGCNGLTPRDKVLIYCYYYMQMHTVSGFHVFQRGLKDHQLNFFGNVVFLDFGCGPLTSGVSLAWHHLTEHPNDEEGLLFHYIGIDRCEAMMAHAQEASKVGGLFHKNSTFDFVTPAQSLETIPHLVGKYRSLVGGKALTIILNCSYLFASHQLQEGGLISFVSGLVRNHLASDKVCLVFQNPYSDGLNTKWERFKNGVKELQGLSKNREVVYYWDVTGRDHGQLTPIKLRREFLLNRKWMASCDIIPF
jgi:hypothetical protein